MGFANEEAVKDGAQSEFALAKKWKTVFMCSSQAEKVAYAGKAKGHQPPVCRVIATGGQGNSQIIVALPAQDRGEFLHADSQLVAVWGQSVGWLRLIVQR